MQGHSFWGRLGRIAVVFLGALLVWQGATSPAIAGAWTRDKGDGLVIFALSIHELLPAQGYEAFDRLKGEASAYGEYGWNDRLTLVGRAAWQAMQITTPQIEEVRFSVEVKPEPDPSRDDPNADYDGDGVSNRNDPPPPLPRVFERRSKTRTFLPPPQSGIGGVEAGARFRLVRTDRSVISVQGMIGVPGSGENGNHFRFGEGEFSGDFRLLAGRSFGRSTFVNVSGGMRVLSGSRPDEIRLDLTAGTHIVNGLRVMAQTYSVWSTSSEYGPSGEYSGHRAQLSVLWPIDSERRAQLSFLTTVGRANMSHETALIASVWRSF